MKKIYSKIVLLTLALGTLISSCTGDLDRTPPNKSDEAAVYDNYEGYLGSAAKVYAGMALTGMKGPAGEADISGIDEGNYTSFIRGLFYVQELPTEEALCSWTDTGVEGMNFINFSGDNPIIKGFYYRLGINITFANDFIKHATDEMIASKNMTEDQKSDIRALRDEVRFLRAYYYSLMIDLFGNPPFFTETHKLGDLPTQGSRLEVFNYIESELLDVSGDNGYLKSPRTNEYGRADKAAAWMLLSRLYLNAKVYSGTERYTDAITYSRKVIDAGYSLVKNYQNLFLADNNLNNPEMILSVNFDGNNTKSYGGTTFLINAAFNAKIQTDYGLNYGISSNAGWAGIRSRANMFNMFETGDLRNLFVGEQIEINDVKQFMEGKATYKFRNITSTGVNGSDSEFADTDFPLFRLSEAYLNYIEAVVRGGQGGNSADAVNYMNTLRERAFGNQSKNVSNISQVTLAVLLKERAKELYWECQRRTDLIRFDSFTSSSYLWEWKGGVKGGRGLSSHYNLYPLPNSELVSNTNLKQNTGY